MAADRPGADQGRQIASRDEGKVWQAIDDGIANLKKCLDIDKENEDAMTYMNLLLRKKADLEDQSGSGQGRYSASGRLVQ